MIPTIHGDMDESQLEKREGDIDTENECTHWVEYWQLVHRSVDIRLKYTLGSNGDIGRFD